MLASRLQVSFLLTQFPHGAISSHLMNSFVSTEHRVAHVDKEEMFRHPRTLTLRVLHRLQPCRDLRWPSLDGMLPTSSHLWPQ
jgi:hypothetical protein